MKSFLSCLSFLLLTAGAAQAMSVTQLTVRGQLVDQNEEPIAGAVVVYKGNEVLEAVTIGAQGKFKITLPNQAYYTLEFRSVGCIPKRIVADTREAPAHGRNQSYGCTVSLVEQKPEYDQYGFLDFPIAVLYFSVKGGFIYGSTYTRELHQLYAKLMQ